MSNEWFQFKNKLQDISGLCGVLRMPDQTMLVLSFRKDNAPSGVSIHNEMRISHDNNEDRDADFEKLQTYLLAKNPLFFEEQEKSS